MTTRTATCRCGQLQAECTGEPFRVSVCHCLDCKRRSGSAFAYQARWREDQVRISGEHKAWETVADSGNTARFLFCPHCGTTVAYISDGMPGTIAVPAGGFADVDFPPPRVSVYDERKPDWLEIKGDGIDRE